MAKVKSLAELKAMREKLSNNLDIREKSNDPDSLVQIKVAMATCGIAAGAKQVMEHMMEKADELKLGIVFTQTGCITCLAPAAIPQVAMATLIWTSESGSLLFSRRSRLFESFSLIAFNSAKDLTFAILNLLF